MSRKKEELAHQIGFDHMIKTHLATERAEMSKAKREELERWAHQHREFSDAINTVGLTMIDLERGGTTPQRYEAFRRASEIVNARHVMCEEQKPDDVGSDEWYAWAKPAMLLRTVAREAEGEILTADRFHRLHQSPIFSASACYHIREETPSAFLRRRFFNDVEGREYDDGSYGIGSLREICDDLPFGERSHRIMGFVIDELFRKGGVLVRGALDIPYFHKRLRYGRGDSSHVVMGEELYSFDIPQETGRDQAALNEWAAKIVKECKRRSKEHERGTYLCGTEPQYKTITGITQETTFRGELGRNELTRYTPRSQYRDYVVVELTSKDEEYAYGFFERIQAFVHEQNQSAKKLMGAKS